MLRYRFLLTSARRIIVQQSPESFECGTSCKHLWIKVCEKWVISCIFFVAWMLTGLYINGIINVRSETVGIEGPESLGSSLKVRISIRRMRGWKFKRQRFDPAFRMNNVGCRLDRYAAKKLHSTLFIMRKRNLTSYSTSQ